MVHYYPGSFSESESHSPIKNTSTQHTLLMELDSSTTSNGYLLLLKGLSLIPISHYAFAFITLIIFLLISIIYNSLEIHFFQDLFSGFSGSPVQFSYNSSSQIYHAVVSNCRILQGNYSVTPWLSSPHLQTIFLNFFGNPPTVKYKRQLFTTSDGGTLALDWVTSSDVSDDESTPIVVLIPGLTSDSSSPCCSGSNPGEGRTTVRSPATVIGRGLKPLDVRTDPGTRLGGPVGRILMYLKHLAYHTAKRGWKVVVSNHRGFGGVPITSDCFYNSGWTEDTRTVVNYLHKENPRAPLFIVGTSIGANIL
ncbi:hypothetical protein L195_g023888, partial [Trifolium pratense]